MAKWIKSDGTVWEINGSNKKGKLDLETMQKLVGGYIEIVQVGRNKEFLLVINEDGKIMGLPINQIATSMLQESYGYPDIVVGPVIIAHRSEVD